MKKTPNAESVNPQVNLRIPAAVMVPLQRRATKEGRTVQALILELVAAALGVTNVPEPARGRPAKAKED